MLFDPCVPHPPSCLGATLLCVCVRGSTDGRNVAFGVVVSGMDTVEAISKQFHVDGKPLQDVVIRDCGVL